MASIAKGIRDGIAAKLETAIRSSGFSHFPTMTVCKPRKVGADEINALTEYLPYVLVTPGERITDKETRDDLLRVFTVQVLFAKKIVPSEFDSDFDKCEETVEELETWFGKREIAEPIAGAGFLGFSDTPLAREPYSRELMDGKPPVFVAAIVPEYQVLMP